MFEAMSVHPLEKSWGLAQAAFVAKIQTLYPKPAPPKHAAITSPSFSSSPHTQFLDRPIIEEMQVERE